VSAPHERISSETEQPRVTNPAVLAGESRRVSRSSEFFYTAEYSCQRVTGAKIVGRSSIRFELDSLLAHEGGHIGYGVIASERRKGYATEILIQSLDVARSTGLQRVLLTCVADNEGSAQVIQRCGGVFESVVKAAGGTMVRRFWIE
jgi:predicted acetyltransferase